MAGGAINLANGLTLSGTGQVVLGSGTLTVNDLVSNMNGGSLAAAVLSVATSGAASFTQSGGTASLSSALYLGTGAVSSGTYALSGNSSLSAPYEYVGNTGSGVFARRAEPIRCPRISVPCVQRQQQRSYALSGSGRLTAATEYIGDAGSGNFTQSGGSNALSSAWCSRPTPAATDRTAWVAAACSPQPTSTSANSAAAALRRWAEPIRCPA